MFVWLAVLSSPEVSERESLLGNVRDALLPYSPSKPQSHSRNLLSKGTLHPDLPESLLAKSIEQLGSARQGGSWHLEAGDEAAHLARCFDSRASGFWFFSTLRSMVILVIVASGRDSANSPF